MTLSAFVVLFGVAFGNGCRSCDSCYPSGPVVSGVPGCSTCGDGGAPAPYYSGSATTISPQMETVTP
ncbi:MAG: hypothetical protein DWQ31_13085 [Planctomycetota bacterium]|nr:MAG: hypothetical protein DWQ31_13085 [Planctomycetota bacterium]REJ87069.1 MAG: hypothetical protein DWQ35_21965 [Planctomycetota bacterium]REK27013.1 MAG: hypothetical protein DWQ42_08110 [Planctomycetota bacterium]REK47260.1 MAG: hypothetical protein DWQ46_04500 [Planctomycetota bacterium]